MLCFLHLPLPPYLFGFISTPPPAPPLKSQPVFPSLLPSLPPALSLGFPFLSLSVILLGKVIKGRHIEGALLHCVILFSCPSPFCLLFLFAAADLIEGWGRVGGRGGGERDKPSMVLCGEIIWRADNARRVSSLPPLFSLPSHLSPLRRKSPAGLGVIQTRLSGYTAGKMSAAPPCNSRHAARTCRTQRRRHVLAGKTNLFTAEAGCLLFANFPSCNSDFVDCVCGFFFLL